MPDVMIVRQFVALIQTYAIVAEEGVPVDAKVEKAVSEACNHFCIAVGEVPEELLSEFRRQLEAIRNALYPVNSRSTRVFDMAITMLPRTI
ncbi:hypothetical protein [Herbaspirillum lusitanum]|uniref:hypothetical protein n=1 Tax=Herbaspirillum lusitanum TaxID=213312 RepID=UPI00058B55A3|nr:hypothetical protein [Herbaspirillum lusitanum]